MEFWIFMFVCALLVPAVMVIFGRQFYKKPPEKINVIFGYRTTMSMKNKDTWEFAHRHIGKNWFIAGIPLLIVTVAIMILTLKQPEDIIGNTAIVIVFVQTAMMISLIFPTESALKKHFDKNGNRK